MATTTPNFGWDVPQSTDLVKDGATAIAALGNDIDTSLVDLKGGTTGQVLSKASNTDLDFTWSSVDPLTILDAKGDLISATAADTPARLASSGVNGDILTVDTSTSTGLKWAAPAGGATDFTLLNSGGTALTGAATITVNITAYTNIYVFVDGASSASASSEMCWRFNSDSGNNYRDNTINWTIGNASYGHNRGDTSLWMFGMMGTTASSTVTGCLQIFGAKSSTGLKPVQFIGAGGTSTGNKAFIGQALYLGTSAITSISIISNTGNFDAGTMYIYGAN